MLALWAASASLWRIGATSWEMNPDRPWVGSWRAVTAVILPATIVIWTWTWPNGFWTTEPVNVPLPLLATFVGAGVLVGTRVAPAIGEAVAPAGPLTLLPGVPDVPGVTTAWPGPSADAVSAGVLKLNRRASPRAVVTMAATARFGMGVSAIRIRSVRSGYDGAGCPAAG